MTQIEPSEETWEYEFVVPADCSMLSVIGTDAGPIELRPGLKVEAGDRYVVRIFEGIITVMQIVLSIDMKKRSIEELEH